jgi:hypothetical protein
MEQPPQRTTGEPRIRRTRRVQWRVVWLCAVLLIFVGFLHYYWIGPGTAGSGPVDTELSGTRVARYQALSGLEQRRLREQRQLVGELARRHVGSPLSGSSLEDLRVIQTIVDRADLAPDQTYELQALGVALGDVMAAQLGLEWIAFEDDYGRNRALRLDETEVVIFPVTMISKRVEAGLPVDVDELWQKARRTVREARPRA